MFLFNIVVKKSNCAPTKFEGGARESLAELLVHESENK